METEHQEQQRGKLYMACALVTLLKCQASLGLGLVLNTNGQDFGHQWLRASLTRFSWAALDSAVCTDGTHLSLEVEVTGRSLLAQKSTCILFSSNSSFLQCHSEAPLKKVLSEASTTNHGTFLFFMDQSEFINHLYWNHSLNFWSKLIISNSSEVGKGDNYYTVGSDNSFHTILQYSRKFYTDLVIS